MFDTGVLVMMTWTAEAQEYWYSETKLYFPMPYVNNETEVYSPTPFWNNETKVYDTSGDETQQYWNNATRIYDRSGDEWSWERGEGSTK